MTQAFNLSQLANNLDSSGRLDAADGLVNAVPVANGGTGQASLTANNVVIGNGTSPVQFVAPGPSGNALLSNGSTWVSGPNVSGATGGGTDSVFYLNDQYVTTSYTIPVGKNAVTAGPIQINTGATVTISTDSTWVVV
jgi:hypothetical protein